MLAPQFRSISPGEGLWLGPAAGLSYDSVVFLIYLSDMEEGFFSFSFFWAIYFFRWEIGANKGEVKKNTN